MKFKRFISVFLLCTCLTGLFLTPAAGALEVPDIQAKAALLADVNTDAVAYAKNIHEKNYPASLTKVMTALLILEKVSGNETLLNQEVTASESAFSDTYYHADGSSAGIKAGEIMTVKQLLQCMLIVSANEACNILAEWDAGSIAAFVDAMNAKAKALGCENTHFVNPSGLHDPDHYTSAWDLYLITKAAMQYPEFMEICDSAKAVIPATNLSKSERCTPPTICCPPGVSSATGISGLTASRPAPPAMLGTASSPPPRKGNCTLSAWSWVRSGSRKTA